MAAKLVAIFIVGALPRPALVQNNSCNPGMCWIQYGICVTGIRCSEAAFPVLALPLHLSPSTGGGGGCVSMVDIVTEDFFNGIINKVDGRCPGENFYTRCAFLDAVNSYPEFGQCGYADDSKPEVGSFAKKV